MIFMIPDCLIPQNIRSFVALITKKKDRYLIHAINEIF